MRCNRDVAGMTSIHGVDFEVAGFSPQAQDYYDSMELKRAHAERWLNVCGYIPLVCTASGGVRCIYGLIEIVSGCVAASFTALVDNVFMHVKIGMGSRSVKHVSYIRHGIENLIRGVLESLPMVFNNLALIAYDAAVERHEYLAEKKERLGLLQKKA